MNCYEYEKYDCMQLRRRRIASHISEMYLRRVMRKPVFCICENKGADQQCCNQKADQRNCLRYIVHSIYFLNPKFPKCLDAVQPGLCRTWSETPKIGFLVTLLT